MVTFSEADIRAVATSQTYSRGYEYYSQGAVSDLVRRGSLLTAQVEGSQYAPYQVTLTLTEAGALSSASCTCPYDRGGYCKHIVAVLLATLHNQEEMEVRPDIETLLADLSEAQLRRLILVLTDGQPKLLETVENEVRWLKMEPAAGAEAPPASAIPIDLAAVRRAIARALRQAASTGGGDGYWEYDEAGTIFPDEVLGPHRELVERLLAANDAARATDVIGAMIEGWGHGVKDLDEWVHEANEEVLAKTEEKLGALLAEALLSQDLSPDQRQQWLARVKDWSKEYFDLESAQTALKQWWDYPPLAAAMQGQISEKGAWEGELPDFADELTLARLRILERQGRVQEYIHLAKAEGQASLYVNMLARSGQTDKAVAEARSYLVNPNEILALAQILAALGQPAAALDAADHGLEALSPWNKQELARWTAALAQQQDNPVLALQAARVAFLSSNALEDFRLARSLARADWPAVKINLLAAMETSRYYNKAEIYLSEGMIAEAMAVIDHEPFSSGLEQVIHAASADYPDWGICKCKHQGEAIMDAGKANRYDSAVAWLRTARDIYLQHGRRAEWDAYLTGLLEEHGRKYKLVPMLKGIR